MAGCSEDEMRGWREELKAKWSEFSFLDPCVRAYNPVQWKQLVKDDIQDIIDADVVLTYMWKPGIGSSMELVEARYRNTPTLVIVPDFKHVSPWIREYADFLVEDFDQAYKIIQQNWVSQ